MKYLTVNQKAKQIAKYFRHERSDYLYIKEVFRQLRKELNIKVTNKPKKLPYVPTEEEIKKYYNTVWQSKNMQHVVMIKILLYTGIRVSELINVKISDVDTNSCQIKINQGKGRKDRIVGCNYLTGSNPTLNFYRANF